MANSAENAAWTSIEDLFDRTLGSRPSPQHLAILKKAETERPEVKEFIHRALRLMAISKAAPANMTPTLAWILGVMIPGLLPGAWGNVVPPFTILRPPQADQCLPRRKPLGPIPGEYRSPGDGLRISTANGAGCRTRFSSLAGNWRRPAI